MQLNETDKMADFMVDKMIEHFGEKVRSFCISDVIDDPNYRAFCITFKAYNYFVIHLGYEKGRFGCSIKVSNEDYIYLENSQKWWEKADFDVFFKELQEEIELRIPDKYLEAKGWK